MLLIGVGGLGAEVAKNIVLAGVRSLTLLDDQKVLTDGIVHFIVSCLIFSKSTNCFHGGDICLQHSLLQK